MKLILLLFLVSATAFGQNTANHGVPELHTPETANIQPSPPEDRIYRTPEVDRRPELRNGMYQLPLFVSQHFSMPDVHNKKIKLFVGFVVETDGSISNIKFIHLNADDIDEAKAAALSPEQRQRESELLDTMRAESVRVLESFTEKWNPAMKDGVAVRCQFNYPINFTME